MLVGAFIIFNAFSMTVAQRRREFAMLRALGASRAQVLASITGEALAMGVFASVLGLLAGLGIAAGVNQLFQAAESTSRTAASCWSRGPIAIALAVGVVVTPALGGDPGGAGDARAADRGAAGGRGPAAVALRALDAVLSPRWWPCWAAFFIVGGMYGPGGTTARLGTIAVGAVLVFVAVAMVEPVLWPLAGALGWPLQKLSPVSGRLARDNSVRNPGRTAATAAALMIGLGVVVFVAVFAQGLKSSFIDSFDRTVRADYIIAGHQLPAVAVDTAAKAAGGAGRAAGRASTSSRSRPRKVAAGGLGLDPATFGASGASTGSSGGDERLTQLGPTGRSWRSRRRPPSG